MVKELNQTIDLVIQKECIEFEGFTWKENPIKWYISIKSGADKDLGTFGGKICNQKLGHF